MVVSGRVGWVGYEGADPYGLIRSMALPRMSRWVGVMKGKRYWMISPAKLKGMWYVKALFYVHKDRAEACCD